MSASEILGALAGAVGLMDVVFKTIQKLRNGVDRKGRSDIIKDLTRLQDLIQIHTDILANTPDDNSIRAIKTTTSSIYDQLEQIESWMLQPNKRLTRLFRKESSWLVEQDRIDDILQSSIRTLESSLPAHLSSQPLKHSSKAILTSDHLGSKDSGLKPVHLQHLQDGGRQETLDWLSGDDAEQKQNEMNERRVNGTGEWLNQSSKYEQWRNGAKHGLMWCFGKPGSGKSMLMSRVVHQLQQQEATQEGDRIAVVYYYFDLRAKSSTYSAMASLLRQLCYHQIPLPNFLTLRWDEKEQKSSKSSGIPEPKILMKISELVSDILSLIPKFSRVYVCLDGLDECSDLVHELIPTLERLASSSCQLFLTSRILPELKSLLAEPHSTLEMESFNQADIRLYLDNYRRNHLGLDEIMNGRLALTVTNQLTDRSHGNFLSAQLQFMELSRQTTTYELKERLENLPVELADTYGLLLFRLAEQPLKKADLARRTLKWLAHSRRPLALSELQQAVSIDPLKPSTATESDHLPPPALIRDVCTGLIEIDIKQNKVLTKHASLTHYLQEFRETIFPDGRKYIADCIISFLRITDLSSGTLDSQEKYDSREKALPFSAYVSQHWGFHLADHQTNQTIEATRQILRNEILIKTIGQILHVSQHSETCNYTLYPSKFVALHFAAYFGLTQAVEDIVGDSSASSLPVDTWGRDAVHIACQQVKADRGRHYHRSQEVITSISSERSHDDEKFDRSAQFLAIVNFMSQRKFNLGRRDIDGRVPMHYAVMNGSIKMATILGKHARLSGAVIDKWGRDPLFYAAERGFVELVSFLLDLNFPREGYALSIAASNGYKLVVDELLDHGFDFNDDEALFQAAKNGFADIVSRLYCQGANQSFTDGGGMNALHYAAHAGHFEVTKYLITEGADINRPDQQGRSPLLLASENGDLATIELLIKRGAMLNTSDCLDSTALDKAAENGHSEVVRYLLRHGARTYSDGSAPNTGSRLTPLQIAGKKGFESVAQVLLEESSSPDKAGPTGRTPLSYAAEANHEPLAKLFLATRRVDVNAEDDLGRTPLSYASQGGHIGIMKLLFLESGVDVNSRDNGGRTPLSYAAEMGHLTAALLLLVQPRTMAEIADNEGLTPRDYAYRNDHGRVGMALSGSVKSNSMTHKGRISNTTVDRPYHYEQFWSCCSCGIEGAGPISSWNSFCPYGHSRCSSCLSEHVKIYDER